MEDRDSNMPLLVGAVVAVLVHLTALPLLVLAFGDPWSRRPARVAEVDQPLPIPEEIRLGQEQSRISTVAWIAHDDFRKLIAPPSPTEQPALQDTVDPAPDAPLQPDPTPPAPTIDATAEPQPPAEKPDPAEDIGQTDPPKLPDAQPQPAQAAATPSDARPTAAPRDDSIVDPTRLDPDELEWKPGGVIVGKGIEITTARPDISILTALRAVAVKNIDVEVRFNKDGVVDDARLLSTSGNDGIDSAVLASLYKWKAEGERLQLADPHIVVPIDYRFGRGEE